MKVNISSIGTCSSRWEGFKTAYTFGLQGSVELSCGQDTTSRAREEQLTADVIDFQITQGLMDFINVQFQGGPHFWFQEEGDVIFKHVRQRMHLSGNYFRSTIRNKPVDF